MAFPVTINRNNPCGGTLYKGKEEFLFSPHPPDPGNINVNQGT